MQVRDGEIKATRRDGHVGEGEAETGPETSRSGVTGDRRWAHNLSCGMHWTGGGGQEMAAGRREGVEVA